MVLGYSLGNNYTGAESNNILINGASETSVLAESGVIRIGDMTNQSKCFIGGIKNVLASNPAYVTINTSTGQLGSTSGMATFSAILASNINNLTGDSTLATVIYDTKLVDTATAYNTSTGIYTCPNTGNYLIMATVTCSGVNASHTNGFMSFITGDGEYTFQFDPFAMSSTTSYATFTGSVMGKEVHTQLVHSRYSK